MRTITIEKIFPKDSEREILLGILEKKDKDALDKFLESKKYSLLKQDILPKYLFYVLCDKFNIH